MHQLADKFYSMLSPPISHVTCKVNHRLSPLPTCLATSGLAIWLTFDRLDSSCWLPELRHLSWSLDKCNPTMLNSNWQLALLASSCRDIDLLWPSYQVIPVHSDLVRRQYLTANIDAMLTTSCCCFLALGWYLSYLLGRQAFCCVPVRLTSQWVPTRLTIYLFNCSVGLQSSNSQVDSRWLPARLTFVCLLARLTLVAYLLGWP